MLEVRSLDALPGVYKELYRGPRTSFNVDRAIHEDLWAGDHQVRVRFVNSTDATEDTPFNPNDLTRGWRPHVVAVSATAMTVSWGTESVAPGWRLRIYDHLLKLSDEHDVYPLRGAGKPSFSFSGLKRGAVLYVSVQVTCF